MDAEIVTESWNEKYCKNKMGGPKTIFFVQSENSDIRSIRVFSSKCFFGGPEHQAPIVEDNGEWSKK